MTEDRSREAYDKQDTTEEHSFDQLARGLASGRVSRKQALRAIGATLLGGALFSIPGIAAAQQGGRPAGAEGCRNPGEIRVRGQCQCPTDQTLCGNRCVSTVCDGGLQFDPTTCQCQSTDVVCTFDNEGASGCGGTLACFCAISLSGVPTCSSGVGCIATGGGNIICEADENCPAGAYCNEFGFTGRCEAKCGTVSC